MVLVDTANVVGARPDGWWRDRAGAAHRLIVAVAPLIDTNVEGPDAVGELHISDIRAVVEGAAVHTAGPADVAVVPAERDGDSTIVEEASRLTAMEKVPLVVTADRGLRRRLPEGSLIVGPGWLNHILGR